MKKTRTILMIAALIVGGGILASCDEFLSEADNPVAPASPKIKISSFNIVGTRTVSPGDVLVFGIDEKAQCVVTLDKKEYTLTGTVEDIPADLKPYIVTEWTSSDTDVATVDGKGTVTALAVGKTTIKLTVSAKDGSRQRSATYILYVKAPADPDEPDDPDPGTIAVTAEGFSGTYDGTAHGITVTVTDPSDATVKYGTTEGTYDLTANPTYTDADTYTVYYEVTKDGYTTVTGSKSVTIAKAAGTISYATGHLDKHDTDGAFTNVLSHTGDGAITYSSNKTAVAEVNSSTGEVTIKGNGSATITATVAGGTNYTYATTTASYTITVTGNNSVNGGVTDNTDYDNSGGDPFGF